MAHYKCCVPNRNNSFRNAANLNDLKNSLDPDAQNLESWKFLLVESGILESWTPGIQTTAVGFRNPNKQLESGIQVPIKKIWNPVIRVRIPRRGIQNSRLSWSLLHLASNRWLAAVRHVFSVSSNNP